jgi:meso-butanediol dehydrogenase/(S,S)-butanediol dehydrogenase/diacetyl reductase
MNVLVTGAGAGIGAATARLLAERGYRVAVTDLDESAAAKVADEIGSFSTSLDVTSRTSIRAAADLAERELGPLDGWVSNAGISSMFTFLDVPDEDWQHMLDVNTTGVFLCGQEFARRLVQAKRPGTVVNLASMAGKQGRVPYLAHYVASKFAVVGLTQAMAFELAAHAIRVNCVCPGYVGTGMQARELIWESELRGDMSEDDLRKYFIKDTPLGRIEMPEDVARVVEFLLGPDSAFVTGEALAVNGGAFMD